MQTPTPPHLAQLELAYATPERTEEFLTATIRGFHDDYAAEPMGPGRAVFEPERQFGYTVDGRWVSTCGAFSRRLTVPGGAVPTAAVTYVTVSPSYRRRGLLRAMMTHQLTEVERRGQEPVALLWASESLIYGRFGYGSAAPRLQLSGPTAATAFRPDVDLGSGSVAETEREVALAVIRDLHTTLLPDRPGALDRNDAWWTQTFHDPEVWRGGAAAYRFGLHFDAGGTVDGYVVFRVKSGWPDAATTLRVTELDAATPQAYARLWRFVLDLDLVREFSAEGAVDEPLRHLVADQRLIRTELTDSTYVRLVDLRAALAARRYAADLDLVLEVRDPLLPANDGRFRVEAGPDGAVVTASTGRPDLTLGVRELGSIYLGGTPLSYLHRAGLVTEHAPGAVAATNAAFSWSRLPFTPDHF